MFLIIEIFISIFIASIPIIVYLKGNHKDNQELFIVLLASIILLIGCLIRTVKIESYPIGFNEDEASIGYESYSLLKYGIDRNGLTFPVHFISWGSGQNALYGYMTIPLVFLFDNTVFSVRFIMSLIGCITLLVAYFIFKDAFGNKKSLIPLFIIVIIPWHIMKSRWGLESNIFPDLIFYSIALIYFGVKRKKRKYFIIASIVLGISTFSYGTSYLFIPIFTAITYIYLIKQKKCTIKDSIIYFFITGIFSLPMILFVIINYFKLDSIEFLNITIPKLYYNRFTEITSVNGNIIINCLNNLKNSIMIMYEQKDGLILNYSPNYGILYDISLPFILLGLYNSVVKNNNILLKINNIFLISSIFVILFTSPNINRINTIWLCLIIYLGNGVLHLYNQNKTSGHIIIILYAVLFACFSFNYFDDYQKNINNSTFYGLENAIKHTNNKTYNNLYITDSINQPYIYYLYFNKIDPNYYIKSRVIPIKNTMFQNVNSIDNVYFYLPKNLEKNNIYILSKYELSRYNTDGFEVEEYNNYFVIH